MPEAEINKDFVQLVIALVGEGRAKFVAFIGVIVLVAWLLFKLLEIIRDSLEIFGKAEWADTVLSIYLAAVAGITVLFIFVVFVAFVTALAGRGIGFVFSQRRYQRIESDIEEIKETLSRLERKDNPDGEA